MVNPNGTVTLGGSYHYKSSCKIWNGSSGTACDPGYGQEFDDTWWTSNYPNSAQISIKAPVAGTGTQQYSSLDEAVASMSTTDKAKAINADTLAKVVNSAWANAAAQPGYNGLPYLATSPVTAAEVQAWQFENPALNPTIGDLLVPAVAPGTGPVPISLDAGGSSNPNPNPTPDPNPTPTPVGLTNVNVVNVPTVRVDWGADPGVAAPSMETTPTASAILSPLLNLMPSLRSFVVPSHSSVCPKPSFSIFEKQIVMESHCAVLDDSKSTLYAVMAFVWMMLGAFIILRA
ncbi:hypothetical protein F2P45_33880 [Massilia sp. CCM 8733]|uniref:Uncharacterized protein n=1 Tax=Massilia mucilaginosa TaxID=2609282 RepID=A0ABX0P4E1_9BURK|nr:hypothetical protein [Massilia mucilaginosa]NHZ93947.1 hypothetical protein [Massilia mucilaginosa]